MASEYLMKKYKDVKPEPPKELTKVEKRKNWWHYHRVPLLIGALVLAAVASFVWEMVSKVEPDYQIAYIGDHELADGVAEQIEEALTAMAQDGNGDGKVVVQVNSYVIDPDNPMSYTVQVSLMGDVSVGQSDFFLLEDPVQFQADYGVLTMEDGSAYDDGMNPERCVRHLISACKGLDEIQLDDTLYLCRRNFVKDSDIQDHAAAQELWQAMIP